MKLQQVIETIFIEVVRVKPKEKVLVVYDVHTKEIAQQFFEYALRHTLHALFVESPVQGNGKEPPKGIAQLMCSHDVAFLITSGSLSHTKARKQASEQGSRIITMPGVTEDMLKRCIPIDYTAIKARNAAIAKILKKTKTVRVTAKNGTDISFAIYNEAIHHTLTLHKRGDFHNLPFGEVFVAPREGTAEGVYVVDGSHAGVGLVKNPLTITVKNGFSVKISGKQEAYKLRGILRNVRNKKAYTIAELGIGTNPKARITGKVLEDEKVLGTCHIALGNNFAFGGKTKVGIHLDGVIKKPTIYCDETLLMKDGKLLV